MVRRIRKGIYFGVITMGILLGGLYFFQESLIFPAQTLEEDHLFQLQSPFEEGFLVTRDGARLNYLRLKAEDPRGIIVYYHGNGGSLERWKDLTQPFTELGWDVLVWDYRGYGKSTGERSSEAMYDDAQLIYVKALDWYSEEQLLVYGRSMGTTFATYVSARNSPSSLVLESPFYSLKSLVKNKYPILPVYRLLKYNFPTYSFASGVGCPIRIFHGTQDRVVPSEQGEALWREFPKNSEFILIEEGGHNDLAEFSIYQDRIRQILR
ncbi:alpha/beta hydrolase [Aureitalea marina]|uniref:Serine aminopeptidase S33 domain-containing protein n=1 Tax=Aureitalea marina TaxID=930804 RepID=A0A2S7KPC5_9FLAO|nr:alpha/beta fold hydrolase [Aureitalea marina]PQB04471.1 hypothetical protein BST85_05825 [Aureitalea marina]